MSQSLAAPLEAAVRHNVARAMESLPQCCSRKRCRASPIEQLVVGHRRNDGDTESPETERKGLFGVSHVGVVAAATISATLRKLLRPLEAWIDDVGLAHIFHANRSVGFPLLEQGPLRAMPHPIGERQFRPSMVPA